MKYKKTRYHPKQIQLLRAMANTTNPIHKLGLLRALIESAQQRGAHPDPSWVSDVQRLTLWGQRNLNPHELHRADILAEEAKHAWLDSANKQYADQLEEESHKRADTMVREMTKGLLGQGNGISMRQLIAMRNGDPIPVEKQKVMPSQAGLDKMWRGMTQKLDPKGIGWGEKEAIRRLDRMVDENDFSGVRGDPAALHKERGDWESQRIGYGLMRKRMESDIRKGRPRPEPTRRPTARDEKRADLVGNYLEMTADQIETEAGEGQTETFNDAMDYIPDSTLNESHDGKLTRRAQIARNMVEMGDDE